MAISAWMPPPPPDPATLQNPAPFPPIPLLHLRSGKVKSVFNKPGMKSAIHKAPLIGPVHITKAGIVGDEHAYEPHRSPDKAIHHYSSAHYALWRKEIPSSAHLFKPGAFGENLFSEQIDETKVCIGDRIAIGEVVLEVTEPRMPCYKLNHRFQVTNMATRTQTLLRCGWLYRVLEPGTVQAGDMIRLLERPRPEWTVARVMYYLFHERQNVEMMNQLIALPALGVAIKKIFLKRLERGETEDQTTRTVGGEEEKMDMWSEYQIVEKRKETSTVTAFVLEAVAEIKDEDAAPVEPGSHVRVKLGGKLVRAYSVVRGTSKRFELGIALDPESRGGSKYMHTQAQVGDVLTVGRITPSFPLTKDADKHIIIAGGIGITAFLEAVSYLQKKGQPYELHFAVATEVPFASHLTLLRENAHIYNKALGQRLNIKAIVSGSDTNTHIYCCGPQRLMDEVAAVSREYGVPESSVHFEQFTVTTSGDPFTAELKYSKKSVEVGPTQTLLEALVAAGMDIESSCEVGNCGTCKVEVCAGRIEHRGTGLLDEEKASAMLSCVSRGIGRIVLDL